MFIRLTKRLNNDVTYVNVDHIIWFSDDERKEGSFVYVTDQTCRHVNETPPMILTQIAEALGQ